MRALLFFIFFTYHSSLIAITDCPGPLSSLPNQQFILGDAYDSDGNPLYHRTPQPGQKHFISAVDPNFRSNAPQKIEVISTNAQVVYLSEISTRMTQREAVLYCASKGMVLVPHALLFTMQAQKVMKSLKDKFISAPGSDPVIFWSSDAYIDDVGLTVWAWNATSNHKSYNYRTESHFPLCIAKK